MKSSLFATFTFCFGIAALQADTKVIQAFEGDGFDSWQTTGTGFGLAQGEVIGAGGFANDLAADDELDGGLTGMIPAGDEEADVRMRELELG